MNRETDMRNLLKSREKDLTDILETMDDLIYDLDKDVYKHILKHIEACKHPEKLKEPNKISVKDLRRKNDEIEIEEEGIKICPLSQAPIKSLYKAKCGHLFEEKVIKDYMKTNKRCPVTGCNKNLK